MRLTSTLALILALPAAEATAQGEEACIPGPQGTVSDCTDLDTTPPIVDDFAEGEFIDGDDLIGQDTVGGPIGADDSLLAEDGEAFAPDTGLNIEVGGILEDDYDELFNPRDYGLDLDDQSLYYNVGDRAVRIDRDTREVLQVRPFDEDRLGPAVSPRLDGPLDDGIGVDATTDTFD